MSQYSPRFSIPSTVITRFTSDRAQILKIDDSKEYYELTGVGLKVWKTLYLDKVCSRDDILRKVFGPDSVENVWMGLDQLLERFIELKVLEKDE